VRAGHVALSAHPRGPAAEAPEEVQQVPERDTVRRADLPIQECYTIISSDEHVPGSRVAVLEDRRDTTFIRGYRGEPVTKELLLRIRQSVERLKTLQQGIQGPGQRVLIFGVLGGPHPEFMNPRYRCTSEGTVMIAAG